MAKNTLGTVTLLITMGGMVALAFGIGVYAWTELADAELTTHGIVAMALGTVFTVALGVGLMALVFYSSRHGYDDDAD